ncbi:MAG TPA: class I tRNA ligase family protein, partial [Vicinamibacteria bacterium]|nr:class I tRNA ligase family protein [Vicinamibacteria bacterium]
AREISFGQDGDFSWERFEARYNADLANNLGNLVSRTASMADKYRGGLLRAPASPSDTLGRRADEARARYVRAMESYAIQDGANAAFDLVNAVNEFITVSEPWVLAKDESKSDRLSQVLYDAAEATRIAAVLLVPVMPESAGEILRRLGGGIDADPSLAKDAVWGTRGDLRVEKAPALWPRLETKP